jgi:hypothetical protein
MRLVSQIAYQRHSRIAIQTELLTIQTALHTVDQEREKEIV